MYHRIDIDAVVFWGALILAGITIAFSDAHADTVELAAGKCTQRAQGDGAWWQGTEFTVSDASCGLASYSYSDSYWRIGYANLGRTHFEENAWGAGRGPDPHWTADGFTEIQGLFAGAFKRFSLKDFSVSGEAGVMLYDSHVEGTAYHWASDATRHINPKHKQGLAPYLRASVGYSFGSWEVTASLQRFYRIGFNQWSNGGDETGGGDHIGPKSVDVTARMVGIAYHF